MNHTVWTRTELHWEMIKPARAAYPYGYDTFCAMFHSLRAMCRAFERFPKLYDELKKALTTETPQRPRGG